MPNVAGVVFGDYEEQQKLQRNTSMVVLRSLGYGKKSIENKILEEVDHLVASFQVSSTLVLYSFVSVFRKCKRGIKVSMLNLAQKSTVFLVQEQFVIILFRNTQKLAMLSLVFRRKDLCEAKHDLGVRKMCSKTTLCSHCATLWGGAWGGGGAG